MRKSKFRHFISESSAILPIEKKIEYENLPRNFKKRVEISDFMSQNYDSIVISNDLVAT